MPLFINKKKSKEDTSTERPQPDQRPQVRNRKKSKETTRKATTVSHSAIDMDNAAGDTEDSKSISDHLLSDEVLIKSIDSLSTCKETFLNKPANSLRKLFAMTENTLHPEYRTHMVSACNGKLVPVLIDYLRRCKKGSSEQYLSLLILNNLSIPVENKRFIALECDCIKILAKLICEDPSCHLICIILVNLSFADSDLRRAIVDPKLQLISALAYTLKVSHDIFSVF